MTEENRRLDDKFALRLPKTLKEQIAALAISNNRSTNAEMVARLERTIAEDKERNTEALKAIQASPTIRLEKRMMKDRADLEQRIDELATEVEAIRKHLGRG